MNTTGLSKGKPFEELPNLAAALDWLGSAGFLEPDEIQDELVRFTADDGAAHEAMARVRAVRAGLRDLFDAAAEERAPTDASLEAINDVLDVPERVRLVRAGDRLRVAHRRDGRPFDQALSAIADAIGAEAGEGRLERFRVCENDRCRWAFYDRSRPGTRRWCEMSSCGNRMKAARHRARHKAEISGRGPPRAGLRRRARSRRPYRTTMFTRRPPPA